jgi:methylated-DNA-[protein]-cysteine S-methyltransferase
MIRFSRFDTVFGAVYATAAGDALTGMYFIGGRHAPVISKDWIEDAAHGPLRACAQQLREYFLGERREFGLPLAPQGSPFQMQVWKAIAAIPYGKTLSYAELAARAGSPGSARAAGAATGRNPLSIIVPCHRVVGSAGSLTGYAGGLERKERLLRLEGALQAAAA